MNMRLLFAAEDEREFRAYEAAAQRLQPRLEAYIRFLAEEYEVQELPRAVVWTGREAATELLSAIPVPAYTNEYRIVFCPDPAVWRDIWLRQLEGLADSPAAREIRTYYETAVNDSRLLSILGHELAHHIALFPDFDDAGARESGIWFEEGMAEYIGRRYFLTEEAFAAEARIDRLLVELLEPRYGGHPLEDFGASTYEGDYASIFFEYWRSFLAVEELVRRSGGVREVFRSYRQWSAEGRGRTLEEWFGLMGIE